MKKFFLVISFLMAINFASVNDLFGSVRYKFTPKQIMEMIERSKEYNPDVTNPHKIYPGQVLTFKFQDGVEISIDVEDGDNQYNMIGNKLGQYVIEHGKVVDYPEPSVEPDVKPATLEPEFTNLLIWLLIAAVVLFLIWRFIVAGKDWRNSDIVTSGPPQIAGGVTSETVGSVLRSRYPGAVISSIEEGRLYGKGTPHYNFNPISFNALLNNIFGKVFNGEPGFQADIITPASQHLTVQTLAGCGNEIKMNGKYFTGLTFIPNSKQPDSFIKPADKKEVIENKEVKTSGKENSLLPLVNPESELFHAVDKGCEVAREFMEKQTAHKAVIEFTSSTGNLTITLDTKNVLQVPSQKTDDKTEKTEEKN